MESALLPWIVLLPLIGAIVNGVFGSKMPKRVVTFIAVAMPVAAFIFALRLWLEELAPLPDGEMVTAHLWSWFSSDTLTVELELMVDPLSLVMLLVVTGVGSLIHVFSIGYMWDDKSLWRYWSYLNLFMFSMLLLILGKNLLVLFVGWEGVGVCSYLLIGFWFTDMQKAVAGKKAFIVNRIGDFGFLLGIFILLFYSQGTLDVQELSTLFASGGVLNPHDPGLTEQIVHQREATVTLIGLLFFVGACGKSAQIPLYVWLPDAMAGPTPVSALIHAATMVTAGVYMMARLNFLYVAAPDAMLVIATVGALTAFMAASIALVQNDIKGVLAYSTVSQLGFMVLSIGVGGFVGAIFHLMTHAFFKACLFLGSGSVIHGLHHEQDIRKMGGLKEKLPVTAMTFFVSCLAIAGIPLFSGFFSKDEILFTAFTSSAGSPILWGIAAAAAAMTAFYMFRLYYLTFEGEYRGDKHTWDHAHEERIMTWPLIALATLAALGGFLGMPAVFIEHGHVLHNWLAPVFSATEHTIHYSHSHSMEWILMGVSTAIAVTGWMIARQRYKRPFAELPVAPVEALWHRVLTNKYYVDEFYNAVIIQPLIKGSRALYKGIDQGLIDGIIIHGGARTLAFFGDVLRQLQNGDVQTYVTAVVVGVAVLVAFFV